MKDIQQLIKKNSQEGRYENIFPKTFTDAVIDRENGAKLTDILAMFNMLFLSYVGSKSLTRLEVPISLRKTGIWITYVLYDKTVVTEWYAGEAIDDTSFSNDSNWRDGTNSLVGDISISSDGYWVINGEVTTIKAQGEAGITPILRVGSNNHLQVSYTNGSSYIDVSPNPVYTQFRVLNNKLQQSTDLGNTYTYISEELAYKFQESGNKLQMSKDLGNTWEDVSDYIAAWFKFTGTTGSSQADNVGKIQISRDNGATWSDLSEEFTNSLHIKGYVATVPNLPSTAVQGDIYGVGPTYDPSDTEHTNPIYQLYVKDSTGWVNNGKFTSIAAGVVQTTGTSTTEVMSQKAVTEAIEFNSSGISMVGDDDNLIYKRVTQPFPIGMSLRIYVKYPEVDYTGVTHSTANYDRFVISARNNEGENIGSLVKLGMNNRTPLAPYYDITIPEGTNYLLISMRASKGFEQQLWVSGASLVNDLTTGGNNNPLTAEQGKILGALSSKVSLIGDNDTLLLSNIIKGIKPNHIYHISLNPDIDIEGITVAGNYDLFACALYDNELENYINVHRKLVSQTLEGDFMIKVPEGYSGGIRFRMRATKGAEQIIVITDITEEYNLRLDLGLPFELIYDDLNLYSSGLQYMLNVNLGTGLKVSELPTSKDARFKTISIDLPENIAWLEVLNHYNTSSLHGYGSIIVDENDTVLNILVNKDHVADSMSVVVPNNAKKLLLSVMNVKPTIICHPKNEYNIEDNEENKDISTFLSASSLQTGGYNFDNPIMGGSVYNGMVSFNGSGYVYLVPIPNGFKTLRCTHFKTSFNYGSAFVDENLNIVGSLIIKTYQQEEERMSDVISIPSGAKFLYYVWYKSLTNLGFNPYIQLSKNAIDYSSNVNSWMNSDIINGKVIASTKSVLLPAISMDKGFHITLNDGYEFRSAHLYYNDNLISPDFYPNPYGGSSLMVAPFGYFGYKVFSVNQILPQFSVRLVVIKSDGSDIATDELIIKEKTIIDYSEFTRITEDSIPIDKIHIIRKRMNQFLNLVWKAEEDIYPRNPGNYSLTHYKKGNTYISVPYSESSEFSKYLGWCVSFRTFLSACMNRRSVMYTERISAGDRKSSYGITYNGLNGYSNPYYGNVCTGFTQYALDLPNLYVSGQYHAGAVPNLSKIDGATSNDVKLFDILWNEGHCSIISDILLDENGDRKYIVWAEQVSPVTRNTVYTLDEFDKRCLEESIEVWRNSKWDTIEEPESTPYIQSNKYEWQTPIVEDEDFHLFCGNYAAFAKGDPIFFNANREKGYTQLEVYVESDDSESNLLSTIDLTSLDNDGLYPEDGGDWVKIDFTNNSLQFGKYKARIISDEIQSKFVYFEIVEISLNAIIGETDTDITYSCSSNGTPKIIRREKIDGMHNGFKILEEQGQNLKVNWTDYSLYSYIKLYVKCDYGMVVKRVEMGGE